MYIKQPFLDLFKNKDGRKTNTYMKLEYLQLSYDFMGTLSKHYGVPINAQLELDSIFTYVNNLYHPNVYAGYNRKPKKKGPFDLHIIPMDFPSARWTIKDGRLVKIGEDLLNVSKLYSPLDKLSHILDSLIRYEDLFPGQSFVNYFNCAEVLKDSETLAGIETTNRFMGSSMVNSIFDLCKYGFPSPNRLHYLYWKTYLRDFCSHEQLQMLKPGFIFGIDTGVLMRNKKNHVRVVRKTLWYLKHRLDNKIWKRYFTNSNGEKLVMQVHLHEVLFLREERNLSDIPNRIDISPNELFKDTLDEIFKSKEKLYLENYPFCTFSVDDLQTHKENIIPINDSFALISEGRRMKHCIGQDSYITDGKKELKMFFRYIPDGISKDDIENHYTVTLVYCKVENFLDVDELTTQRIDAFNVYHNNSLWLSRNLYDLLQEDEDSDVDSFYFQEAWGYKNKVPDPMIVKDILKFLFNNQHLFIAK